MAKKKLLHEKLSKLTIELPGNHPRKLRGDFSIKTLLV